MMIFALFFFEWSVHFLLFYINDIIPIYLHKFSLKRGKTFHLRKLK